MDNLFTLHRELRYRTYRHSDYQAFRISDPKPRHIHKALVRDRIVHHAIYRTLYPLFDKIFIADSFSCRNEKGTHKAILRFKRFSNIVSKNNRRTCWVLQCDVKRFFANMHHATLLAILEKKIADQNVLWLCTQVIQSFALASESGLPLGNLTSQLFANVYMNPFDQFVKHALREKYYIRYADDFVVFSDDREYLIKILQILQTFLGNTLNLQLHEDKVFIKTLASGIDFLGWVHFPDHRVLRTSTKRRMIKNMRNNSRFKTMASYQGLLQHGNTNILQKRVGLTNKLTH